MSNKSQLFQPDPVHLQALKDNETALYYSRVQSDVQGKEVSGAMVCFETTGLQAALDRYAQLISLGYSASTDISHLPQCIVAPTTDYVIFTLRKPDEVAKAELAEIHHGVESVYLNQLDLDKQAAVAREVEFQLVAERRKEQLAKEQAQALKDAEDRARIEAEVLAALGGRD